MWARIAGIPLVALFAGLPAGARAAFPETWPALYPVQPPLSLAGGLRLDRGLLPAFSALERDRFRAWGSARWWPAESVGLEARYELLEDLLPDGERRAGPGDLVLGTLARAWEGAPGGRQLRASLGWQFKLPNAPDESGLGTDEADCLLYGQLALLGERWAALEAGLGILGNPLRYADQDDPAFARLLLGSSGRLGTKLALSWVPRSAWNPARARLDGSLSWGSRWRVVLEAGAGLDPAGGSWSLGLGLAWAARGAAPAPLP